MRFAALSTSTGDIRLYGGWDNDSAKDKELEAKTWKTGLPGFEAGLAAGDCLFLSCKQEARIVKLSLNELSAFPCVAGMDKFLLHQNILLGASWDTDSIHKFNSQNGEHEALTHAGEALADVDLAPPYCLAAAQNSRGVVFIDIESLCTKASIQLGGRPVALLFDVEENLLYAACLQRDREERGELLALTLQGETVQSVGAPCWPQSMCLAGQLLAVAGAEERIFLYRRGSLAVAGGIYIRCIPKKITARGRCLLVNDGEKIHAYDLPARKWLYSLQPFGPGGVVSDVVWLPEASAYSMP